MARIHIISAFIAIAIFALPTDILASGFAKEIQKGKKRTATNCCPHCGKEI